MAEFLVSYDLGDDLARAVVRKRGALVGQSAYLVVFDGSAKDLLLDLLAEMALDKKVTVTDVIEKGETVNVFRLTGEWYGLGGGTDYTAAERVLGSRSP